MMVDKCPIYNCTPGNAYNHHKCRCKICVAYRSSYIKIWKQKNPEKMKKYNKNTTIWRKNHPEETRRSKRKCVVKSLYNITMEDYDALFKKQNGLCAICGKKQGQMKLNIDHNHTTGEIRGLLCSNCNRFLGLAQDSEAILTNALRYLKENK